MGLLEVLEWKLPVRSKTLVLVNLSAFVCVYQTQIPPNTQRMGALPYQSGSFLTLCNGTLSFLAKKMGRMRRILGTILVAISQFLQTKSDSNNRSVYSTALSLF